MNTPFKLKSGNKPDKPGFFGTMKGKVTKFFKSKHGEKLLKLYGYSDKDIKGK